MPKILVEVGDLVFLYSDGNKNSPRPRYIVTARDKDWVTIKKLQGGLFSNKPYQVKPSEIFKIPDFTPSSYGYERESSDTDDEPFGYLDEVASPVKSDKLPATHHIPDKDKTTPDLDANTPELDHPGCSNTGPPKSSRFGRKIRLPAKLADYDLE